MSENINIHLVDYIPLSHDSVFAILKSFNKDKSKWCNAIEKPKGGVVFLYWTEEINKISKLNR